MEGAVAAVPERAPARPGDPSWRGHVLGTLALGLPLIGAQIAQMLINVTDTLVVGRLGATELAAAVLATQGFFLVWIFGSGIAQGVMPDAAAAQGRGDAAGVRRAVRMGFWVLVLYGAATVVPLWHYEAILLALGQDAEVSRLAGSFMRVLAFAMLPALLVAGARSALTVIGEAGAILLITLGGVAANALLVVALVFGRAGLPALGLNGAALASVAVNVLMAAAMLGVCAFAPGARPYRFFQRIWRPDWPVLRRVVRIGLPISLTIVAEVGLFAASSVLMGWLGAVALAAHGIALQLASLAFMVPLGLAQAATVRVGIAFGRADWRGLARAGWVAAALATLAGLCGAALFLSLPEALVGLYLDADAPTAPAVLRAGVGLLAIAAAFQLIDCLQVVSSGILRGLADTRVPMLIAVFSYWGIGMPVAWLLGFRLGLGGAGVWAGLAAGLLAAAVLMTGRFALRARFGLTPA